MGSDVSQITLRFSGTRDLFLVQQNYFCFPGFYSFSRNTFCINICVKYFSFGAFRPRLPVVQPRV